MKVTNSYSVLTGANKTYFDWRSYNLLTSAETYILRFHAIREMQSKQRYN